VKPFIGLSASLACALAVSNSAAQNVYLMPAPTFNAAMYNPNFVMGPIIEDRLAQQSGTRSKLQSLELASLQVAAATSNASPMPAKIASNYPAPARAEAERVFRDLLGKHPQLMRQLGAPAHDLAAGVATFVAGSWMAYRNVDLPDEHFKPLVSQMRQIIGSNPDFAKATSADKQEMYEQMAILGMFMATTQMALKEKPNPPVAANLKQAAKGYLEQFLKTDAERVQITARGLVLR
jgi:hypothetical protein